MPAAFQYRPKFVDIRVRPPEEAQAAAANEPLCEQPGCDDVATARAPKGREHPNEFWRYCKHHAADYNKRFNYYAGMTEPEIAALQEDEVKTGGRPTWEFRASSRSREAAAKMAADPTAGPWYDPFGMLRNRAHKAAGAAPAARRLGRAETRAYEELDLATTATPEEARAAYAALIKRMHPDSNGGDRGAEARLQRVIKAWRTLKDARLV